MWTTIIIIFLVLLVLAIVFRHKIPFIKGLAENASPKNDPSVFASTVYNAVHFRGYTPKGAAVYAYQANPSAGFRELADAGIQQTIERAQALGFTEGMSHSDYAVSAWPKYQGNMGFLVELMRPVVVGDDAPVSYDQGQYDKDPRPGFIRLLVAGNFISKYFGQDTSTPHKLAIGLVDDPSMTKQAAEHEAVHAVLFMNDPVAFQETINHESGKSHELFDAIDGKIICGAE